MAINKTLKVFLLHGEESPYRIPLFESISKDVDLTVYHCMGKSRRRKWSIPRNDRLVKNNILKSFNLGPFVINPTLLFILFRHRYDVYIISDDQRVFFSTMVAFSIAKLLRKPVIFWSGMTEINYFEIHKRLVDEYLLRGIGKCLHRFVEAFIAYGEHTKDFLLKEGISGQQIFSGTQAICQKQLIDDNVNPKKPENVLSFDNKKVVLCISYFERRKGLGYLIESFKELNREDVVLVIAGAGGDEKKIKSLAAGSENIYFPGHVEFEKKTYYYSISNIFVFPTLCDAWGLVVNEAMAFGLPVITTKEAGCSKELIDGNGFLIKPENKAKFKKVMEKLLDDDLLRLRMGLRSKEIIKKYTIENSKKTFLSAIEYVLCPRR